MKKHFLFLLISFLSIKSIHAQIESAGDVLNAAYSQAKKENKKVFIIFHASWCVWCHRMDSSMNDKSVKSFFDKNYVIRHLTVLESKGKENLENPGAQEMLVKYKGEGQGIPYWLIFDKDGNLLADSQIDPGVNTGCPASKEEVAFFIEVLKKTSSIKPEQVAAVEKIFRKKETQ